MKVYKMTPGVEKVERLIFPLIIMEELWII